MNAIWIVLPILTLLMFELGLTLQTEDFQLFRKRPRPIIAGLVGQIILLPMLAFALGHVFQLEPLFFIGIILIACSPGGSSSNIFSMIAKGDVALSVSLTACSSIITLFTIPVIMEFATHFVDSNLDIDIHLPVGSLIMQNLVLMLLPIVAGIFTKRYRPQMAERIHKILSKTAFPALILLATIFFIQHHATITGQLQTGPLHLHSYPAGYGRRRSAIEVHAPQPERTTYTHYRNRYAECRTSNCCCQ